MLITLLEERQSSINRPKSPSSSVRFKTECRKKETERLSLPMRILVLTIDFSTSNRDLDQVIQIIEQAMDDSFQKGLFQGIQYLVD
jgi:hypothetical protein